MNKYDVAGLLRTCEYQVMLNGNSTEKLRDIVRDLKEQLDLRKIYQPAEEDNHA